ncbi:MAG: DUF721 domain-containing protein [Thermoguttaceae bacterium]|nr:DUF721 domain-containing protein [Thermoguttaceae bacterium]
MKKSPSSKSPGAPKRQKTSKNAATTRQSRKTSKKRDDPFAAPPHPLGFNFLSEERPLRASKFGAILPTIVAKYGFGRKIGVERFHNAWNDALATVFRAESLDAWNDWESWESGENWSDGGAAGFDPASKLATYTRHARPVAFRGGTLSVCVESRLLCQELSFYLPQILREIQTALPDENVERIKLVVR